MIFSHKAILVVSTILNAHVHLSFARGFQHCFWSSIRNILAKYHKPHWLVPSFISFHSDHASLSSLGHVTQITPLISIFTGYFLSCVSIIFRSHYSDHTSDQYLYWLLSIMRLYHLQASMPLIISLHMYHMHCTHHSSLNHGAHLAFLACYQHFIWSTSNLVMNFTKVLVFLFSNSSCLQVSNLSLREC